MKFFYFCFFILLLLSSCSSQNDTSVGGTETNSGSVYQIPFPEGTVSGYDQNLVGAKPYTVLFFGADWCQGCVEATKNFRSSPSTPDDLTLMILDYSTDLDLRKKYGVTVQHTFVQVDDRGEKIASWVGGYTFDDVLENIKS